MEPKKSFFSSSAGKLICRLGGHRFRVSKTITDHIREYKCTCCGEERTDTANGFLERLTPKFRETNEFLAQLHQRRRSRRVLSRAS